MTDTAPVPPQSLEAEESVLGAMMLSEGAIEAVLGMVNPSDFYRPSHGVVFEAAVEMYAEGQPVDAITLATRLDERGKLEQAGGKNRIHELAVLVPATANVRHYAKIVRDRATLRGLAEAGSAIAGLGYEGAGDIESLLDKAHQLLLDVSMARSTIEFVKVTEILGEIFETVSAPRPAEMGGVPSGFRDLDRLTDGFQPGNLIIVAARPSVGKSALGLNVIANAALRHKTPVGLFTLEMSRNEVVQRLISTEARVDSQAVRFSRLGQEDWTKLSPQWGALDAAPIYLDDSAMTTMLEMRMRAKKLKLREPNLGLLVVDYLQLMSSGQRADNRNQEISQISRQLKILARDLDVPIIAISQLSREVERRGDKRPILSDLRDSGSIEQDADLVMLLYRDEYYNPDTEDIGVAELNLAKHRNGPTDMVRLSFQKRYTKFGDLG